MRSITRHPIRWKTVSEYEEMCGGEWGEYRKGGEKFIVDVTIDQGDSSRVALEYNLIHYTRYQEKEERDKGD